MLLNKMSWTAQLSCIRKYLAQAPSPSGAKTAKLCVWKDIKTIVSLRIAKKWVSLIIPPLSKKVFYLNRKRNFCNISFNEKYSKSNKNVTYIRYYEWFIKQVFLMLQGPLSLIRTVVKREDICLYFHKQQHFSINIFLSFILPYTTCCFSFSTKSISWAKPDFMSFSTGMI